MEEEVLVRCLPQDRDLCKSVVDEAVQEYKQFMKDNAGLDLEVEIEVSSEYPLTEQHTQVGGIVMCCQNNNIIFQNT